MKRHMPIATSLALSVLFTGLMASGVEAQALIEQGNELLAEHQFDQLRRLLKSPYLPYEVRAEVTSARLGEATTISSGT